MCLRWTITERFAAPDAMACPSARSRAPSIRGNKGDGLGTPSVPFSCPQELPRPLPRADVAGAGPQHQDRPDRDNWGGGGLYRVLEGLFSSHGFRYLLVNDCFAPSNSF